MSMSQEEIEALMSGAGEVEEDNSTDDLENTNDEVVEKDDTSEEIVEDVNIDDMLAGIDGVVEDEEPIEDHDEGENIDDILAGIDGIVDDVPDDVIAVDNSNDSNLEELIEESQYPLPARPENKVVNQLNEVAEDSEEKASQIFDVLSFILDENSEIQNYNKKMGEFIIQQTILLESLKTKFPNISVFNENLELAKDIENSSADISDKIDAENNKVFEAMELMQFHDINRQKIERVMAVIKKLNNYLNGIFEDDSNKPEVQIAKHISGDSSDIVGGDDLEALISEFAN